MVNIRVAAPVDSDALVQLTALTAMKGTISLRIDREPDFFALLKERGDYTVFIAEDGIEVIGSLSIACQKSYINGKAASVYYLGDLKVHPAYLKSTVAYRLLRAMQAYLLSITADLLLCTAALGNGSAMPLFKGRAGFHKFKQFTTFSVFQILPKKAKTLPGYGFYDNSSLLAAFYAEMYKRYVLSPAVFLNGCINFACEIEQNIKAAVSLYDPTPLKQNVVVDYPLGVAIMLNILKKLKPLLGLGPIPQKNEPLRILYIKHYGFMPGFETAFLNLLDRTRNYAFVNNYHFVSIAIDEKDKSLLSIVKPRSRFVFRSAALLASLHSNTSIVESICGGLCFEDYSLI
jgi:hypothetical protein